MTLGPTPVSLSMQDGVAVILIDHPPVNATSHSVRAGILAALRAAQNDAAALAIVIAGAGRTFVAGGDMREFGQPSLAPELPEICNAIEASAKPVVASLNGAALGGGLEIALACHARVMQASAHVALPEAKLGLIPGSGGTQRLPRLVGVLPALDLISSGRQIGAVEALALKAVDLVVEDDVLAAAVRHAKSLSAAPLRRTGALPVAAAEPEEVHQALMSITRKARGKIAPVRAAALVQLAGTSPLSEGLRQEREAFLSLMESDQSRALRHAFFAEREAYRPARLQGVAPRTLDAIGVIGAGTMGAGIAVALADAGLPVTVIETSFDALAAGKARISSTYDRMVRSNRISEAEKAKRMAHIQFSLDMNAISSADIVVEAVFEDMQTKQAVFARLGAAAKPGAVLASNTSYLDIDPIAAASGRSGDVIGLHFFAPANIMRLVEVIRCSNSAPDALATGFALARRLRKVPVICGICDGFVANRILAAYRAQAEIALEEGALPQDVDAAMEDFGFPMGPFAVADLSGLDIAWARRKRLAPTRNPATRYTSRAADQLCAMGRFGQKTGAGWYAYADGKRLPDPQVASIIASVSAELGIARRPFDVALLQRRLRAAMVNEGAKILSEGVADRPTDVDLAMMHGLGYPAWRGGPMFEADRLGAAEILKDVEDIARRSGPGWEPADLLVELARTGGRFTDGRRS